MLGLLTGRKSKKYLSSPELLLPVIRKKGGAVSNVAQAYHGAGTFGTIFMLSGVEAIADGVAKHGFIPGGDKMGDGDRSAFAKKVAFAALFFVPQAHPQQKQLSHVERLAEKGKEVQVLEKAYERHPTERNRLLLEGARVELKQLEKTHKTEASNRLESHPATQHADPLSSPGMVPGELAWGFIAKRRRIVENREVVSLALQPDICI